MSTFCGKIEEIPFISVDCFVGENLKSKIFFLSHCHTDHMQGLQKNSKLPGPLYTSPVSAVFIKKAYPSLTPIHILETDCPEEIEYEDDDHKIYSITVTTLSARHCPGSVMFLFQTTNYNILYTGDFRISRSDLEKNFGILQETTIDIVHLDSTFLNRNFKEFPPQIDSINALLKLVDDWLKLNPQNIVYLDFPARYGSEYLLIEIYRKLKQKTYIDDEEQCQKYNYFPEMDHCISLNRDKCRIQVLRRGNKSRNLIMNRNSRVVKVSAFYWRNWKKGDEFVSSSSNSHDDNNLFRVACSYHCSLMEIKDFLDFIKPKKIKLNVVPLEEHERQEMYKTLRAIYPQITSDDDRLEMLGDKSVCLTEETAVAATAKGEEKKISFTNIFNINRNVILKEFDEDENPTMRQKLKLPKRKKL